MNAGAAFAAILNMSIAAGLAFLAVLALNWLLKRAKTPSWLRGALWLAVLFRLLCPVSFSAAWSPMALLPSVENAALSAPPPAEQPSAEPPSAEPPSAEPQQIPNPGVTPIIAARPAAAPYSSPGGDAAPAVPLQTADSAAPTTGDVLPYLWLSGAALLLAYSAISYAALKRRLATATRLRDNIYISESVSPPFVCGFIKPRIYLPLSLSATESAYIVRHEQIHIRRLDHLLKALWYFACCLHWFNPLAWLAFWQMSRDMEISCDEAVLRELGMEIKAEYSGSLLALASRGTLFAGSPLAVSPLAFGETGVKERVRRVLAYQKPALWLAVLTAVVVIASVVVLLADPRVDAEVIEELTGTNVTLLVGVDKRPGESSYRTDTIILSFFNSDSNELKLLSLPRDSYVQLPGQSAKVKISEAYFYGGMTLLKETVEYALGLKVNNYAELDFAAFVKVIDLLGGVELDVPQRMYKPTEEIDLQKGLQTLNGYDALALVRFRDLPMGDLDRIANQQAFMRALAAKLAGELSVWKAPRLADIAMENTRTDYTLAGALSLANAILKADLNNIAMHTLPGEGMYIGNISYWVLDQQACIDTISGLAGGAVGELHIIGDEGRGMAMPQAALGEVDEQELARLQNTNWVSFTAPFANQPAIGLQFHPQEAELRESLTVLLATGRLLDTLTKTNVPQVDEYVRVTMQSGSDSKAYFVYQQDGRYFIDRPYLSRRETGQETYEAIMAVYEQARQQNARLPYATADSPFYFITREDGSYLTNARRYVSDTAEIELLEQIAENYRLTSAAWPALGWEELQGKRIYNLHISRWYENSTEIYLLYEYEGAAYIQKEYGGRSRLDEVLFAQLKALFTEVDIEYAQEMSRESAAFTLSGGMLVRQAVLALGLESEPLPLSEWYQKRQQWQEGAVVLGEDALVYDAVQGAADFHEGVICLTPKYQMTVEEDGLYKSSGIGYSAGFTISAEGVLTIKKAAVTGINANFSPREDGEGYYVSEISQSSSANANADIREKIEKLLRQYAAQLR